MKTMAKAKRRKVWVTFEGEAPTWVEASAKMAKAQHLMGEERPVAFVEHRPGDVVLSREDVRWLRAVAEDVDFDSLDDRRRVLVLLRGGR